MLAGPYARNVLNVLCRRRPMWALESGDADAKTVNRGGWALPFRIVGRAAVAYMYVPWKGNNT